MRSVKELNMGDLNHSCVLSLIPHFRLVDCSVFYIFRRMWSMHNYGQFLGRRSNLSQSDQRLFVSPLCSGRHACCHSRRQAPSFPQNPSILLHLVTTFRAPRRHSAQLLAMTKLGMRLTGDDDQFSPPDTKVWDAQLLFRRCTGFSSFKRSGLDHWSWCWEFALYAILPSSSAYSRLEFRSNQIKSNPNTSFAMSNAKLVCFWYTMCSPSFACLVSWNLGSIIGPI